MIPVVAATVACFGCGPWRRRSGESFWMMQTFGLGMPAIDATSSTIACSCGSCSGVTSFAPVIRSASLSENQYEPMFMTSAKMNAKITPAGAGDKVADRQEQP